MVVVKVVKRVVPMDSVLAALKVEWKAVSSAGMKESE